MAVRFTSLMGVVQPPAKARLTSLMGVTKLTRRIRLTNLKAVSTLTPKVRFTALIGRVDLDPAAPRVTLPRQAVAVPAGCPVKLSAAAIPTAPATVTAWTWRVLSKSAGAPAPILTGTTGAVAGFEGRATRNAQDYTIGVQAVDSVGRRSPETSVTITVDGADMLAAGPAGWTPVIIQWTGEEVTL